MKMILHIIPLGFYLLFTGVNFKYNSNNKELVKDSIVTINLSFVGDLMCHSPQMNYAKISKDSFDFNPPFAAVKNYLSESDLTFGNLETVISDIRGNYSGYPNFNSPEEYLDALHNSGFDYLFTSNNHCADKGVEGIFSTLKKIKKYGMIPIGTNENQLDRDSSKIIYVNGITIGLNSYTYGLNGHVLPKGKKYLANVIDTNNIRSDIEKLKIKNPDIILIYFHFGEEYSREPSMYQKQIVDKTFNYGADIIIASHPHVIQNLESRKKLTGKLANGLIAYSLGNFFSNQQWRYSDSGIILNLELSKNIDKDSVWVKNVCGIPTWVFKGNISGKRSFLILPSDTALSSAYLKFLKHDEIKKLVQSYNDTELKILSK